MQTSMENVKELNTRYRDEGVQFGETTRTDMLEEEKIFPTIGMPAIHSGDKRGAPDENSFPQPRISKALGHTENNVPAEFNWFNVSGVKHIARNQGQCGSCWAHATIGSLEMQAILEGHEYVNISVQQAIDWFVLPNFHHCFFIP